MLARAFAARGPRGRGPEPRRAPPGAWRVVAWDGAALGPWAAEIDGGDAVVNLAGRSVNCRYTAANRREILDSRVALHAGGRRGDRAGAPAAARVAAGEHGDDLRAPLRRAERRGHRLIGGGEPGAPDTWRFSIDVASAWERALDEAATPATRKVALRSAMTMSPDRGRHLRHAARAGAPRARRHAPATAASTSRGSTTRLRARRAPG